MPVLTRYFVKTSFIYLFLGLLAGTALVLPAPGWISTAWLFPVYLHLLTVGWLTSLIFGIVCWMFPKYSREKPRRSEALGWMVFISLNGGLILRAAAEPLNSIDPGKFWGWMLVLSALLQWLAGIGFIINSWSRVKER